MTKKLFHRIIQPLQDFIRLESSAGLILMACTVIALILANSSLQQYYISFWQIELPVGIEGMVLKKTLLHWINDGLMCFFFFVVGLEIKRELLIGELASVKRAIFPIAAALGGMIIPALIYYFFTSGTEMEIGWGILMPAALGIIFGLVIGKQIGITLFSWISVKAGLAELPSNVTWQHIFGIGLLGGIGFTMSLFVASLAFTDEHLLNISKTAVLLASLIAGCIGFIVLRFIATHDPVISSEK